MIIGYVTGLWLVPLIRWFVFAVLALGAAGVS